MDIVTTLINDHIECLEADNKILKNNLIGIKFRLKEASEQIDNNNKDLIKLEQYKSGLKSKADIKITNVVNTGPTPHPL